MKLLNILVDRLHRYSFYCFANSIKLCLKLKEKIGNKKRLQVMYIVISPYLLLKWMLCSISEVTIGSFFSLYRKHMEKRMLFNDNISIVAIAKNEAPYIIEWIEFHKLVGVTRFYIYDNESSDNLRGILKPYIENGEVIYTYFPGKSKQLAAYNDAIKKYKSKSRYMAFIDLDEFLAPGVYGEFLPVIIDNIVNKKVHTAGIGVTWRVFGSSGYKEKPDGLVTENYLKRGVDKCWQNYHIKTVCNPRMVKEYVSPHFPLYKLGAWSVNENGKRLRAWFPLGQCYDKIKINHYFCKSREEALLKWNRGLADRNQKYDWKKFEEHDLNDVYDDGMLDYISQLKENISKIGE